MTTPSVENSSRYYPLFLALAIALLYIVPAFTDRPFASHGEPREALVARAMIQTGNYILPPRYDDDFATKPPFLHWLVVLTAKATGELNEQVCRFPPLLISIFCLVVIYRFLKNRFDAECAFWTVIVLATTGEWFRASANCRVDILFSAFFVMGLLAIFKWSEKDFQGVPFTAILALALATLSKGPVAIVLAGMIIGLWSIIRRQSLFSILRIGLLATVPAIFISGIWYLLAYRIGGSDFLDVIMQENFKRFTGSMSDDRAGHRHSVFYVFGTLFIGLLPWAGIFAVCFLTDLFARRVPRLSLQKMRTWYSAAPRFEQFSTLCGFCIVLFFCIPDSKRSVYLLPAYPFIAYFIAKGSRLLHEHRPNLVTWVIAALAIVSAGIYPAWGFIASGIGEKLFVKSAERLSFLRIALEPINYWPALMHLLFIGTALYVLFRARRVKHDLYWLVALLIAAYTVGDAVFAPPLSRALSHRKVIAQLEAKLPREIPIYSFEVSMYGVSYYLNRFLYMFPKPGEKEPAHAIVLVDYKFREKFEEQLSGRFEIKEIGSVDALEKFYKGVTAFELTRHP